jgi:hypothetical protein
MDVTFTCTKGTGDVPTKYKFQFNNADIGKPGSGTTIKHTITKAMNGQGAKCAAKVTFGVYSTFSDKAATMTVTGKSSTA